MILTFVLSVFMTGMSASPEMAVSTATNLVNFRSHSGQKVRVECHGDMANGPVWGTGRYADDSSVCTAAVHFGVIDAKNGGTVIVRMMQGTTGLVGSSRNGVASSSLEKADGSFVFVSKNEWTTEALNAPAVKDTIVRRRIATWDTRMTDLRGEVGERVLVTCPSGERSTGPVWGTDVYSDDSAVCLAGLHAGVISNQGGEFLVEIEGALGGFLGSVHNGVSSHSYGEWPGSFRVVKDAGAVMGDCTFSISIFK